MANFQFKFNPITKQFNMIKDSLDLGTAFQGPYDNGIAYSIGQAVSENGKLFVCLQASTGQDPDTSPTYWDQLEIQGPTGLNGAAGGQWFNVSGPDDPDTINPGGEDGDHCLKLLDGSVWERVSGTWTDTGTLLKGDGGINGTNGLDGSNGADGVDGATWTVGTSFPGSPATGDLFLHATIWEVSKYNGSSWDSVGIIKGADGSDGANGTTGADGADGADGATWTVGTSFPGSPATGDLFLHATTWEVSKYNGSSWDSVGIIKGADGSNGIDGANGQNGSDGSRWFTADTSDPNSATISPSSPAPIDGDQCLATDSQIWRSESSSWVDTGINIKGSSGSGSGNVIGPLTSVTGNIPTYNNSTGDLLNDSNKAIANVSFKNENETRSAYIDMADNQIKQANLTDWNETKGTATLNTTVLTLDLSSGNVFEYTLVSTVSSIAFQNLPTGKAVGVTLKLTQPVSPISFTWAVNGGGSIKFSNATVPTMETNDETIVALINFNTSDTIWYATSGEKMGVPV